MRCLLLLCCLLCLSCACYGDDTIMAVPLHDKCIKEARKTKIFVYARCVEKSDGKTFIDTSTYGRVEVNNLKQNKNGYYLPAIMMLKDNRVHCGYPMCGFNPECQQNLESLARGYPAAYCYSCGMTPEAQEHAENAIGNGLAAAASVVGVSALAAVSCPVAGIICAASAGYHLYKTAKNMQKAYDCYQRDENNNNNNNNDQSGKQQDWNGYDNRN